MGAPIYFISKMNFKVDYSISKDKDNYISSIWNFRWHKHGREKITNKLSSGLPKDLVLQLINQKKLKEAELVVEKFLNSQDDKFLKSIEILKVGLEKNLNKQEKNIIETLETAYVKPVPFITLKVYITTIPICPYNFKERWFMVFKNHSKEKHIQTAIHELNHFMFYFYYWQLKDKVGSNFFEIIKEALTVLTNPEEAGYPGEKYLRKYIAENRNKNIEVILNEIVENKLYLKT